MNSFEINKILGAILGTCLVLLAVHIAAGAIFAPKKPAKPGYAIAVASPEVSKPKAPAAKVEPIAVRLAQASAQQGQESTRKCQACHDLTKGGPNRIGPNLWNIVGSARGEDRGGFDFSTAMKAKGGTWTYEELDKFLTDPQGYIAGTKMTFAGVPNPKERANVIAYLRTLSDNPEPLPKVAAGESGAPAAQQPAPAPANPPAANPPKQ
jgi:cytochrome c